MLEIKNLCFSYGNKTIINNLSLSLPATGAFAIMGPSGCGKSTLISLIMGLAKPNRGEIKKNFGKIVCAFQEPRLLPWMSTLDNVNLVLGGKSETIDLAKEKLSLLGLSDDMDKMPHELSGGMQKRAALARAFAYGGKGDIYIFDEPFGGLDTETKEKIYPIFREISKSSLLLFITHDEAEALACADKIYLFSELNKK